MFKKKFTLEEFEKQVKPKNYYWPVGAVIELKDGRQYLVGMVNPLLVAIDKTLDINDIVFVYYD